MANHWKSLPVSEHLHEPLPLGAVLSPGSDVRPSRYASSQEAILEALNRSPDTPVFVVGRPGGGKTSALRWLAYTLAGRAIEQDEAPLPVYVDFGSLALTQHSRPFREVLSQQLLMRRPIDYRPYRSSGRRLVCILDGADLVTDYMVLRKFLVEAWNADGLVIVVSSRPDERLNAIANDWGQVCQIYLDALDAVAREEWLRRFTTERARERFRTLVAQNPHLSTLLDVPLLFAMTASVCVDPPESAPFVSDEYPGRAGPFAGFVAYAIGRAKGNRLDEAEVDSFELARPIVESLCLEAARAGLLDRIPEAYLQRHLKSAMVSDAESRWRLAANVLRAAGLLNRSAGGYSFLHQQFQEFFAARAFAAGLATADKAGRLEGYAFPVLENAGLDAISSQALAILSRDSGEELVLRLFNAAKAASLPSAMSLLAASGAQVAGEILAPLLHAQSNLDSLTRIRLIENSREIPSGPMVAALERVAKSSHENSQLRVAAVLSLGRMAIPEAQDSLSRLVGSSELPLALRVNAIGQGGRLADRNDWPLLENALSRDDVDPVTKQTALEQLVRIDARRARPLVESLAKKAMDVSIRIFAGSLLARLDGADPKSDPNLGLRLPKVDAVLRASDPGNKVHPDSEQIEKILGVFVEGNTRTGAFADAASALMEWCRDRDLWRRVEALSRVLGVPLEQRAEFAERAGHRLFDPEFERKAVVWITGLRRGNKELVALTQSLEIANEMMLQALIEAWTESGVSGRLGGTGRSGNTVVLADWKGIPSLLKISTEGDSLMREAGRVRVLSSAAAGLRLAALWADARTSDGEVHSAAYVVERVGDMSLRDYLFLGTRSPAHFLRPLGDALKHLYVDNARPTDGRTVLNQYVGGLRGALEKLQSDYVALGGLRRHFAAELQINGSRVAGPLKVLAGLESRLDRNDAAVLAIAPRQSCPVHGDLHFENVRIQSNRWRDGAYWLIDPKGFANYDYVYDVAKMLISLSGHGHVDFWENGLGNPEVEWVQTSDASIEFRCFVSPDRRLDHWREALGMVEELALSVASQLEGTDGRAESKRAGVSRMKRRLLLALARHFFNAALYFDRWESQVVLFARGAQCLALLQSALDGAGEGDWDPFRACITESGITSRRIRATTPT